MNDGGSPSPGPRGNAILPTLALGLRLAAARPLALIGIGLACFSVIALAVLVAASAQRGWRPETWLVTLVPSGVAWSAGVMIAIGAALQALARDHQLGLLNLAKLRGVTPGAYAAGRVGGLFLLLAATVGGATVIAVLLAEAARPAGRRGIGPDAGALAYALAFAVAIGALSLAAMGGRSRARGYLLFVALLILPEVISRGLGDAVAPGWWGVTSIPAALEAVRDGVARPLHEGAAAARALVALGALTAGSLWVFAARTARAFRESAR